MAQSPDVPPVSAMTETGMLQPPLNSLEPHSGTEVQQASVVCDGQGLKRHENFSRWGMPSGAPPHESPGNCKLKGPLHLNLLQLRPKTKTLAVCIDL